jgi:hypothetical protein
LFKKTRLVLVDLLWTKCFRFIFQHRLDMLSELHSALSLSKRTEYNDKTFKKRKLTEVARKFNIKTFPFIEASFDSRCDEIIYYKYVGASNASLTISAHPMYAAGCTTVVVQRL